MAADSAASRWAGVPLEVWNAVLRITAERWKRWAASSCRGYAEGLVGRALLTVLRLFGPRRTMLRMAENYRTADNVTEVKSPELSPTAIDLEFSSDFDMPTYIRGCTKERWWCCE